MSYILCMRLDGIDWDDEKNEINTSGEDRTQTLGRVGKVLFVAYTERGEKKRIITARKANMTERRSYHGYYQIDGKGWARAVSAQDT